ncbi:V-set and immunoglobulin domain-containing protein 10 isoform X1 [Dendrobates tinctorius]|uniref:V-set and immunoglobulin domain-containing protein 10 isoform X1 n=1 Tax=Dendrobates tinctorius TaxID=92724 RepID=UPI003CC99A3C
MGPLEELLLVLCVLCRATSGASVLIISGEKGGQATLPCSTVAENAKPVIWFIGNLKQEVLNCSNETSSNPKYSRLNGSSLVIKDLLMDDEGLYGCKDCSEMADTPAQIQLKISSGPHNITFLISPTKTLPNGTHYTSSGSNIIFSCTSYSIPEPTNSVTFQSGNVPELFHSVNASSLNFYLGNVAANYQGNYTCSVVNPLSKKTLNYTLQLLVYHPPAFPMKCSAQYTAVPSGLALTCSWLGGYPSPLLQWENGNNVLSNGTSDTLEVTVNGSQYPNGQKLVCKGKHSIANIMKEEKCEVQLRYPMPQTEALRTCFKGENVTLSCTALEATPPAVITWLRNLSTPNVLIKPGPRYHITESGLISYLTIVNCSKEEDEGSYICMTENGVATKDIYIYLDITTPHNIIGLVSAILILLLIVIAIIIGTVLYCDPQFYMKAIALRKRESEVLVLVESEEEEEMQEVGDSVANTQSTIAEISSPAAVNGNVYKHEVLFHSPPDNLNSDLLDELPEETNGENLVEGL